jgi:aspartyl-tRNA(Asn)/glutamyl-tRNA(Gln) amidotransferase subunit B
MEKVDIAHFPVKPENLGDMINLIADNTISGKIAKDVFEEMLKSHEPPKVIVERKGLVQVSDVSAIEQIIDHVLTNNKGQVETYLGGKQQVFGFLVGETMKATKGKANPKIVNDLLKKKLDSMKS